MSSRAGSRPISPCSRRCWRRGSRSRRDRCCSSSAASCCSPSRIRNSRRRRSASCRSSSGVAFFFGRRLRRASTGLQDRVAESHRHGQRSVLADPHGAELRARGGGDAPVSASLLSGVVDVAVARAKMRATLFGIVGFVAFAGGGRRALAGRTARARRRAHAGRARVVPPATPSPSRRRSARWSSLFGSYQEAVGAAQRVFELLVAAADRGRAGAPRAAAQAGARRGRAGARALPLRARAARGAHRRDVHDRAGRGRRARRAVGRGQDDGRVADPAILGRDRRAHHARRRRRTPPLVRRSARRDRARAAGAGAVQRLDSRQHRLRTTRTRRTTR